MLIYDSTCFAAVIKNGMKSHMKSAIKHDGMKLHESEINNFQGGWWGGGGDGGGGGGGGGSRGSSSNIGTGIGIGSGSDSSNSSGGSSNHYTWLGNGFATLFMVKQTLHDLQIWDVHHPWL